MKQKEPKFRVWIKGRLKYEPKKKLGIMMIVDTSRYGIDFKNKKLFAYDGQAEHECIHAILEYDEIMEYIGNKDNSSPRKEIYEEDLIQCFYKGEKTDRIMRVRWWDSTFWPFIDGCGNCETNADRAVNGEEGFQIKIVGNTYENPDYKT